MKKIKNLVLQILLITSIVIPASTLAQTDKKQDQLNKLEAAVNNAKAKHQINENKLAKADSLIASGEQMVAEADEEYLQVDKDLKIMDKEYLSNHKSLTKQLNSKDQDEAAKAKIDLKTLETQYKTDSKSIDTRIKDLTKKATKGNANIDKGKDARKTALAALKESQKALDDANEKYEEAVNEDDNIEKE